jgi:hypothetical protein
MSNEFNRLDKFDILIRRMPGRVSAGIPALGLFVTASDVRMALAALEEKSKKLEADIIAADMTDLVESAQNQAYGPAHRTAIPPGNIRQFTIKAGIVVSLIAGMIIVSGALLAKKFNETVERAQQVTKIGGGEFWRKVENEIARAADSKSDMPEKKRSNYLRIFALS